MMDVQVEQKIRERAYEIWLEAGRAPGHELEHWAKAERDVAVIRKSASLKPAAGASATKPAVAKVAKAKIKTVATKPAAETAKSVKAKPDAVKSLRRTKAPTAEVRGTLN